MFVNLHHISASDTVADCKSAGEGWGIFFIRDRDCYKKKESIE